MKKNKTSLQVGLPCDKNWDEMLPNPTGRFCLHCQTDIIDFTDMSDDEIMEILSATEKRVCGRFKTSQLRRELNLTGVKSTRPQFKKILMAFTAAFAIGTPASMAQEEMNTHTISYDTAQSPEIEAQDSISHTIRGTVVDDSTGEEIIGATVLIKGTKTHCISDIDGNFSLKIPEDSLINKTIEVEFHYIGCIKQNVTVNIDELPVNLSIRLKEDENIDVDFPIMLGIAIRKTKTIEYTKPPAPNLKNTNRDKKK